MLWHLQPLFPITRYRTSIVSQSVIYLGSDPCSLQSGLPATTHIHTYIVNTHHSREPSDEPATYTRDEIELLLTMAMVYRKHTNIEHQDHGKASTALLETTSSPCCDHDANEHRHRVDAYRIAILLRCKLVADLVRPIVSYAGLYNQQTSISDQYQVIRASDTPSTCLQSDEISCRARTKAPVREVTFTIVAKGQGFGTWPGSGQWTWFSAAVMKCGGGDDMVRERVVARNSLTPGGFGTHQVTWSSDSVDEDEARWMRGLGVGDRVVVRGHARHSGWSNFVKFVGVTVSTVVIVR